MGKPYYRRRMGLGDHVKSGEISFFDEGLHDFICINAQHRIGNGSAVPPGVWMGSARSLWILSLRQDEERKIRRSLEKLERLGWIKRWMEQGRNGDYPILIARLVVRDQDGNDFSVNADDTKDWKHPVLVPVDDPRREVSVKRPRGVREASGYHIDGRLVDCKKHSPTDALQIIWKEHHGILPEIREFGDDRKKKLTARLKQDSYFLDKLKTALQKLNKSEFIQNGTWKPGVDWLLANESNLGKVLEGNYDDGRGKNGTSGASRNNSGAGRTAGPHKPEALSRPVPAGQNALTSPRAV